jgi:hypothetical protein
VDPAGAVIVVWQFGRPWWLGWIAPGALYWAQLDIWDSDGPMRFAALFGYQQDQIGIQTGSQGLPERRLYLVCDSYAVPDTRIMQH